MRTNLLTKIKQAYPHFLGSAEDISFIRLSHDNNWAVTIHIPTQLANKYFTINNAQDFIEYCNALEARLTQNECF